jgi:hypothetical protein
MGEKSKIFGRLKLVKQYIPYTAIVKNIGKFEE